MGDNYRRAWNERWGNREIAWKHIQDDLHVERFEEPHDAQHFQERVKRQIPLLAGFGKGIQRFAWFQALTFMLMVTSGRSQPVLPEFPWQVHQVRNT